MGKKDKGKTTVDRFKIIFVTIVNHERAYHGKTLREMEPFVDGQAS